MTAPISFSMCGRSPSLHDVRDDVRAQALQEARGPCRRSRRPRSLRPAASQSRTWPSTSRSTLVLSAAAQALVGGDDDDAHALHRVALDEERMAVLGVGVADVRGDVADLLAVRARHAHALLRPAHLRGGDHLHRLGDLAGVLHALDLGPDFFGAWHGCFDSYEVNRRFPRSSRVRSIGAVLLPVLHRLLELLLVVARRGPSCPRCASRGRRTCP